jgi:hypothetical protein
MKPIVWVCPCPDVRAGSASMRKILARWSALALVLVLFALLGGIASAQDDDAPAARVRKVAISASGPVTIAGGATCPSGTPGGDVCYSISGTLTEHKIEGSISGTVATSSTPLTTSKTTVCYSIDNHSNFTFEVEGFTGSASLTGEACITTTKKGSTETLKRGVWETLSTSELSGHGRSALTNAVPTNPTSSTPFAGGGTLHLTGTLSD